MVLGLNWLAIDDSHGLGLVPGETQKEMELEKAAGQGSVSAGNRTSAVLGTWEDEMFSFISDVRTRPEPVCETYNISWTSTIDHVSEV